ncbi:uncharacterized protein LOC108134952 [Drosophila elegans]|uniref:uncharacterized protein LOC108134952 n=1 Tax=Drosophila elegans TaxID=30023 RepID=UPI0007E721B6|nr:uncharacterized protein LOC108134952 [Drosophila elegans]
MNSRFDEQAQLIQSTIREVEERVLEMLQERLLGVTTEMTQMADRILQLEHEVEELRSLKSQIGTVQGKLESNFGPRVRDSFRVRKSQNSLVEPPILIKLQTTREKVSLRALADFRRTTKQQLSIHLLGFDSPVALYVNEKPCV